jgi:predicted amidohydrolase YtcJ
VSISTKKRANSGDRLLLTNARIFGDSRNAVLIESGKIKEISGSTQFREENVIDFQGDWLLPGFIDSHVHFLKTGLAHTEVNLSAVSSISEVLSCISENARERDIVRARALAPHRLKEKRCPTRQELDSISSKVPIVVFREDFHSAIINTKAFEILSVAPTDIVKGETLGLVNEKFSKHLTSSDYAEAYVRVSEAAMRNGVTTISGIFSHFWEYEEFLKIESKLPITVVPFIETLKIETIRQLGLPRIGGCVLVDGSVSSSTAAFFEDYADDQGNRGVLYFDTPELRRFVKKAGKLQIAMHAIGNRAIGQLVSAYSEVPSNRNRIEHAELIEEDMFEPIKQRNMIVSAQPSFVTGFREVYEKKLGKGRARRMNPFRKIIDSGIHLTFGSDSPVTPIDPLHGIRSALSHPNRDSRITEEEAIRCFTYEGAYANFLEHRIGQIEEGLNADIVRVSPDFSSVNLVIKDGKVWSRDS